ncbi:ABC transporter permease [Clostridioides mangenotii]|uniref:ABC transporter permease n=1 Tax=Metaclostridioides mangenotii TaxID=1540 RepID=UPI001C10EF2D|nr:ABC transporter permease [Clostridioides mangenotii]MBU5306925.1 ABC transporter permease [Clostridioides mangenotii]
MKNDLNLVFKYIKSYKARSIAIILSMVMGTALIVGVGTLARSAQQADLDRMKRELGGYHVYFKDINKEQVKIIENSKDIKSIGMNSYYASTDIGEKLPINFVYADQNYLNSDSKIIKGKFPSKDHEVAVESWILNSLGLEPKLNQEISFKLYEKDKPETFKVVGILQDRYKDKSIGRCEIFLPFENKKLEKMTVNVEFFESTDIRENIKNISKNIMIKNPDKNIGINRMLISSVENNGSIDYESRNTAIMVSLFAGLVVYSIFSISVFQRLREYGVLRAVGSTNIKVFRLILLELTTLSAIAIPIGILLGMGSSQIFNILSGNISFEGDLKTTPFVIPVNVILLSVCCIIFIILFTSIVTYLRIRKISPVEAIRRDFGANRRVKIGKLSVFLGSKLPTLFSISLKNIFRNKISFIIIIISISIAGLMIIKQDYSFSGKEEVRKEQNKLTLFNGDFVLTAHGSIDKSQGIDDNSIAEINKINGIKQVKAGKVLYSRMTLNRDKILNMDFYNNIPPDGYEKVVLNGLTLKDNNKEEVTIKQKLKGFDKNMLNSLNEYLVEGNIDTNKMKSSNTAVVYIPHVFELHKDYYTTGSKKNGKPIVDINIGDTVKVKVPKGKINMQKYWRGEDNYKYNEYEFKVGAIVDYPYADDGFYTGSGGVDIIVSDTYFRNITGIENYDIVFADMDKGADHKAINKKLGKIGSKTLGTSTIDMVEDKINSEKMDQKLMLYNYGIVAVIFIISIFNIFNSVSYNILSRTNEFGMLRAVGITEENFVKIIGFEGVVYGAVSSIFVVIGGLIIQSRMYKTYGFEGYGLDFTVNYKIYLGIIGLNIIIGLLATYIPARKIKKVDIVESINIVE